MLRKVAQNLQEEVPVLGSNLKKTGYIHEVKSAISEFMQYGIHEKEMQEMLEFSKHRGSLYYKLKDLNTLYQGFCQYIENKYITTEETMDRLAECLERSKLIRGSVVVLDGFTGFTPVQNKVVEKLLELTEEVIVTITLDSKEKGSAVREEDSQGLFSLSRKTMQSLTAMAEKTGAVMRPAICLEELLQGENCRFREEKALGHLEEQLFRYPQVSFQEETESIHIYEAENMEEEVKRTCVIIRKLLEEGYCYRDIAVISGDLEAYGSLIEETFEEFEIPFFLDRTFGITLNPFIEYIRSALQVVIQRFSYYSVFHFLRSGMVDLPTDSVDKLENYVLMFGIKGKKAWNTQFVRRMSEEEGALEELEELNRLREQVAERLSVFQGGKQNCRTLVEKLYTFLTENQCQQKLKAYEEWFRKQEDPRKEKEYAQIYRLVMDLLNQIVSLLGDETMTLEEFAELLDAGFGEIQVGAIPQAVDRVVVGDMERTRLKQVKALLFLGVNDGNIPGRGSSGGILSDMDREFLSGSNLELAPTPRQQMFIQRFYLYLNVTKPSHRLYLSYADVSREGKSMKPSYFIAVLQHLFPKVSLERKSESVLENLWTEEGGRLLGARLLRKYTEGTLEQEEETLLYPLLHVLEEQGKQEHLVQDMLEAAFVSYYPKALSREAAKLLYGTMIYSSISRLEKMASCAYAHFLQYGLKLEERKEYGFENVDMGNVFHAVLEIFARKLSEKNYTWISFPEEEGRKILREALENYAIEYGNTVLFSNARNTYVLEKMNRILWRTVETLQYQLQKGKFLPENYEISFSVLEDLDAVNISLNEEEKLRLGGRIDRLDTYEDEHHVYVKVMDYKSGSKQFHLTALYYGLELQLVVYLNAAMELQKKKHPDKEIVPAAFVYYHMDDPMVEGEGGMTEEEIRKKIYKQLCVSGIVNSDPAVLTGLDQTGEEKSDVIPVEYKKDGSLGSRSSVYNTEEIGLIAEYAMKKAGELGRRIADGDVEVNPCTYRQQNSCEYCQFKNVCGFDGRIPGYEIRELQELEPEVLWEKFNEKG